MDYNCVLDCEFTNLQSPKPVSIGLVAVTGNEFYAEVFYPRAECGDFVIHMAILMLGRNPHAICTDAYNFRVRLDTWLRLLLREKPQQICFDSDFDTRIFRAALDGAAPKFYSSHQVRSSENNELLRRDFFAKSGLAEHHALYDARSPARACRPCDMTCMAANRSSRS